MAERTGGLAVSVALDRADLIDLFFLEHSLQAIAGAQPRGVSNYSSLSAMFDNANLDTEIERSIHL